MTGKLNLKTKWGPFSPNYLGISHILDAARGSMADLPLFVGRRDPASVVIPDSAFDFVQNVTDGDRRATVSAVPEDVSPDYSSFALRYFLDPQGDTALARFTVESDARARCEITFHNGSDEPREYFYGLGLTVADARKKVLLKESLRPWWIPGRDYSSIQAYQKTFALGCRQCLSRVYLWGVEDEILSQAFGGWPEDRVTYRATLPKPLKDGFLYFRYIKFGDLNPAWELRINGRATAFHFPQTWAIPGGGWGKNRDAYEYWRLLRVPVGSLPETDVTIELRCLEAPGNDMARIWLDGMLFSEGLLAGDEGEISPTTLVDEPLRESSSVTLEASDGAASTFQVNISGEPVRRVTMTTDRPPAGVQCGSGSFVGHLRQRFQLPPARLPRDTNGCPWGCVDGAPVVVPARSERTVSFTIALDGVPAAPKSNLIEGEVGVPPAFSMQKGNRDGRPTSETIPNITPFREPHPASKLTGPYADMAARLGDILLFNINYPLNLFGSPSAYYVPAKYFPLPYSWDGGLAAVGLATVAPDLALQQAAYFLADEEHDFPFIYCGSPVPTPLYAIWDTYQATQDLAVLSETYAGAKRLYDFYIGRTPGSTVDAHNDGFLSTYAYNYNLGIDDHPIQRWAEACHLTSKGLYSIILMPQMLRLAGIMRNMAILLGHEADAGQFRKDAELLAGNIEGRMWDEESGLYGWAHRTGQGVEPVVFDGCAGDRTACAFLPLFAGLTAHKDRLIAQMMDPKRFNTPFGISSVDMLAPSYNPQGYWNGGIWPVLQWFLWRGLLEAGEPEVARQVAETILTTWQRFHESEHYFGEHFMIAPRQMNGAPNFGGLSSVLLPIRAAYFAPYQATALYNVVILKKSVDRAADAIALTLSAPCLTADTHDLLVNMGCGKTLYSVTLDGQPHGEFASDENGHLSLKLPRPSGQQEVAVQPVTKTKI